MNSIEIMVEEHKYIKRMIKVIRQVSLEIMDKKEVDYNDFDLIIAFVRKYADQHHHGKEEKFLFDQMKNHLGPAADKLITNGMLVEHDLGRLYMSDASEALAKVKEGNEESKLDLIANVMAYGYLLTRHIGKEDTIVYTFAEKHLAEEIMNKVNDDSKKFEEEAKAKGTQKYYIDLLEKLEKKYLG